MNPFEIQRAIRSKESGLTAMQRIVLQEIVDRARNGSGVCTWSTAEIAEFVGLSERHCREIIAELEAAGLLVIERRGPNKFCVKAMRAGTKLFELAREFGKLEPRSRSAPASGTPVPAPSRPHPETSPSAPGQSAPAPSRPRPETSPPVFGDSAVCARSPSSGITSGTAQKTSSGDDDAKCPREEKTEIPPGIIAITIGLIGSRYRAEVESCQRQLHRACGGDLDVLIAAAKYVARQRSKGVPIRSSFGMMVAKAKDFARDGIPAEFRPAPPEPAKPILPPVPDATREPEPVEPVAIKPGSALDRCGFARVLARMAPGAS